MDGLFLNQKTNINIRILYSLKYKHLKKIYSLRKNKINKPIVQCQLGFVRGLILQRKTPAQQPEQFHIILQVCICVPSIFQSNILPKILHLVPVTLSYINGIIIVLFKSYLNQCFKVSQLLKYDGNIVVKYVFSMPCCGKGFSKPSYEA